MVEPIDTFQWGKWKYKKKKKKNHKPNPLKIKDIFLNIKWCN